MARGGFRAAPIFFEQQRRLARARTMHSGFNKTATIRVKTARLVPRPARSSDRSEREEGRGHGSELYRGRRENGKAEGNLNEETRDNAWAKRSEQNGTERRGGEEVFWWLGRRRKEGGGERVGENNRGIKLETTA